MKSFLEKVKKYFTDFGTAVVKGNIWTKLSLIIIGMGYIGNGQIIKGILFSLVQLGVFAFVGKFCAPYMAKLSTLGTVQRKEVFDPLTFSKTVNKYDNSLLILLYGVVGIVIIFAFILFYHNPYIYAIL